VWKVISKDECIDIMELLNGECVWVNIHTETVNIHRMFAEFEFLVFESGEWQFGHLEYDEENEYQNIIIHSDDIQSIQRDEFAPTVGSEQVVLVMVDDVEIIVEINK